LKLIKLRPDDFQVPYCVNSDWGGREKKEGKKPTVLVNYSFLVFCPDLFTASEEK